MKKIVLNWTFNQLQAQIFFATQHIHGMIPSVENGTMMAKTDMKFLSSSNKPLQSDSDLILGQQEDHWPSLFYLYQQN